MALPLALLFDVDGTIADTESAHRDAFNEAFVEEKLGWYWSEPLYGKLLSVAGGKERLAAYWHMTSPPSNGPMPPELIERVHAAKTRRYTDKVSRGQVPLRPGIARLFVEARALGLPMAIVTTTTPANIDALLSAHLGTRWRSRFAAVADGATAPRKKPHPDAYLQVLDALGLPASACLAFEDSHNGLRAARAAGVPTIVTPTAYTLTEDFTGALTVLTDLGSVGLDDLAFFPQGPHGSQGAHTGPHHGLQHGPALGPPHAARLSSLHQEGEPCPDPTLSR